jgi:PAS domain S-box-containing protein
MLNERYETVREGEAALKRAQERVYADGLMATCIREFAWEQTPLGAMAEWTDTLVGAVNLMLECQFAAILIWGPEMVVMYNDGYQPLMAEKHPCGLGRGGKECWGEAWHIIGEPLQAVIEDGEKFYFENQLIPLMRQGELKDVYWTYSYSPVRNAQGGVCGVFVVCHDVTEKKATEKALRLSEARFRKLFQSDLLGIGIPDSSGGFRDCNDELLRLTGYTRADQEAGRVRWDLMTPEEYKAIDAEHILEGRQRGSCTPYEKEFIRKDGTRVSILCGFARVQDSTDEFVGFALDLSVRKQAEMELREREERFRVLAESLPAIIWMSNNEGENFYCNRRYPDYVGGEADDTMGLGWRHFIHPDDLSRTDATWKRCLATSEPYLDQFRLRRKDGMYRHFLSRAVPLRNEVGEVERWIGSATDIHDQKLAEDALRKSEKLATAGRLAASIAHEINNPLEGVTNALYLALQDESLAETTKSYLEMAEQELMRVSHITTQTLRFHRQSKQAAPVDVCDLVDSVLTLFRGRLASKNIVVKEECERGAFATCFGDEIRQVLANLVSNALDATTEGRLRVRVRRTRSWTRGEWVEGVKVVIADTGSGIPATVVEHIFEPFITTKEATGIGLGLWVSEGIVRKHGGWIRVRSQSTGSSRGTAFEVFLPAEAVPVVR